MKKLILSLAAVIAFSAEFQYGSGSFKISTSFPEYKGSLDLDVKSFSLVEFHKNIFNTKWFYKYDLTYYSSEKLDEMIDTTNEYIEFFNAYSSIDLPTISYKLRGIDFNFVLGRDISKSRQYRVSAGVLVGASFPWLESNSNSNSDTTKFLEDSKTKLQTYKVGFNFNGDYGFNRFVNLYASTSFAYQMGKIKNDYVDVEVKGTGRYNDLDLGVRFTPFSMKKKIWFFTLSPKFYVTFGYKYKYWKLKHIESNLVDIDGFSGDVEFKNRLTYAGIGYDF